MVRIMDLVVLKIYVSYTNSCNIQLLHISMCSWQPFSLFSETRKELGSKDPTISLQECQVQIWIQLSPSAVTTAEHCFSLGLRNVCELYVFPPSMIVTDLSLHI